MKTNIKVVERRSLKSICRILFKFLLNDTINSLILLLKKNKSYKFNVERFTGLNLGSSTDTPMRWLGISGGITIFFINLPKILLRLVFPFSKRSKKESFETFYQKIQSGKVLHHNLFYGIPFANNTIPFVFTSHFLEHLTYDSAQYVITESFRVLKPGGAIRVLVPSLDIAVEKIKDSIKLYEDGDIAPIQKFMSEPYDELPDSFSYHHHMYNAAALIEIIEKAGFVNTKEMIAGEGIFPDLPLLEKRRSLIVEAMKPVSTS